MTSTKYGLMAAASLAVSALVLSGCSVSTTETQTDAETPEVLNVAAYMQYPPFRYYDENNQKVGIEVDLINAIGERLGKEVVLHDIPFDSIVPGIANGRYDFAIGQNKSGDNVDTVDILQWTTLKSKVVVAKGNPANLDPADLCGARMGGVSGSREAELQPIISADCEADGKPPIATLIFRDTADQTQALLTGQIQGQFMEPVVARYVIEVNDNRLEMLEGDVPAATPLALGWVFRQDDQVFLPEIAAGIESLKEDGTWQEMLSGAGYGDDQIIPLMVDDEPLELGER